MKVSELTGDKLDYWVGMADEPDDAIGDGWGRTVLLGMKYGYSPSTNWDQCGELIESRPIRLLGSKQSGYTCNLDNGSGTGSTPQEAICRAVVASKYGAGVSDE